jgi:hypothetical protein
VALEKAKKRNTETVRVLTLEKNRGKGGAVIQVNTHVPWLYFDPCNVAFSKHT